MTQTFNLFQHVRNNVVKNEVYGKEKSFNVNYYDYNENIMHWICAKQKAFKISSVERNIVEGQMVYKIHYKDVYTECDFLQKAYNALKAKIERSERKGYSGKYANESVTNKFNHINDEYRDELQCKNYLNSCYERLAKEDDCTFELFLNTIGFNSYKEFAIFQEKYHMDMETIEENYKLFVLENKDDREFSEGYIY